MTRMPEPQEQLIVQLYREGDTIRQVATKLGKTYDQIRCVLKRRISQAEFRPRGGDRNWLSKQDRHDWSKRAREGSFR